MLCRLQAKTGVISGVGGLTLGKPGLQIQVLSGGLSQMPAPQPSAPVQTQVRFEYTHEFSYTLHEFREGEASLASVFEIIPGMFTSYSHTVSFDLKL